MKNPEFLITLAEKEVAIRFHFSGTGLLFRSYEKKPISDDYHGRYLSADPEKIRAKNQEKYLAKMAGLYEPDSKKGGIVHVLTSQARARLVLDE